jgi:tRNA(fMet)-specific endonuclease VapC
MVLLDTDHMSLLQRGGAEGQRIRLRLRALPQDDIATTIVSYEEQMRGWLARLARVTTMERQIFDYGELKKLIQSYCSFAVLDYDTGAAAEFQHLLASKLRIGTMDMKIAAVVLANNAVLLTRNSIDFGKVTNLHIEDWSL